jgi:hypothetical protein
MAQANDMDTHSADRRPSFASDFPRTGELDGLVSAFARGDYARVRADAPKLIHTAGDDRVRAAARTLVERTKPDPAATALVVLAAMLLVIVGGYWIANGKAPGDVAPAHGPPAANPRR